MERLLTQALVVYTAIIINSSSIQYKDTFIPEEYQQYCVEIGEEYNICPELLMAIIEAESGGNSDARNKGCKGLTQINQKWHLDRMEKLGVTDIYDPYGNILLCADYLQELAEKYQDVAIVLAHYHGEKNPEEKEPSYYVRSILARSEELERVHGK